MNITDKTLQSYIKQSQKDISKKYHFFSIGANLWFRVHSKSGSTAWLYRIALPDSTKKSGYKFTYYTIGTYPIITLQYARHEALSLSELIKQGINPLDKDKKALKAKIKVSEIWQLMLNASKLKPRTIDNYNGMYKNHVYKIGDLEVEQVNNQLIYNEIIKPVLDNGNHRHATLLLAKIKQAFNFAYESFVIEHMPIDSRLVIPNEYKTSIVRENTISNDDLPLFLKAVDKAYSDFMIKTTSHHLLKLILMLGTRKTELTVAKWEQYNKDKQTLLLTETKTGDDLLIKLPIQAVELLNDLYNQKINDYIFYSDKTNLHLESRNALKVLNRVIDRYAPSLKGLTVHDLRRTFSSRLAGLGFRFELIEKATNHRIQGTARHYQHDDMLEERYQMLQSWADYLDEIAK